jgi:hypothetical protein
MEYLMAKKQHFAIVEVTMTKRYAIPIAPDGARTEINGWPMDVVLAEWFDRYPLYQYHASRDAHEVGCSERASKVEVVDQTTVKKNFLGQYVLPARKPAKKKKT